MRHRHLFFFVLHHILLLLPPPSFSSSTAISTIQTHLPHSIDNACLGDECCGFSPTSSAYSQCSSCDVAGFCASCYNGYYLSGSGCSIIYSRVTIIIGAIAGGIVLLSVFVFCIIYTCKWYYNRRPTVRVTPARMIYPRDSASTFPQTRDPPPIYPTLDYYNNFSQYDPRQQQQQQQQPTGNQIAETQFDPPGYESPPPPYSDNTQAQSAALRYPHPIAPSPWQP